MAETLTYDPTPADQPELNEEEQNSLEVGEKIAEQEGELLAGKYKDAQELESAYLELQKKLGSDDKGEETAEEAPETKDETEKSTTAADDPNYKDGYSEDGAVNYEKVNEIYGDKLGKVFEDASLDPFVISKTFHDNKGTIPDEMKQSLIDSGLSEASVNSYLAGRAAESGYTESNQGSIDDLTAQDVSSIQNSVGGEKVYKDLMEWGSSNLSDSYAEAFDNIVQSGNPESIQIAVQGLKAQYDEANGYEGRMLSGKAPKSSRDVFRSQAEVVKAMSDERYEKDPAYRNDIYEKLERSNVNF